MVEREIESCGCADLWGDCQWLPPNSPDAWRLSGAALAAFGRLRLRPARALAHAALAADPLCAPALLLLRSIAVFDPELTERDFAPSVIYSRVCEAPDEVKQRARAFFAPVLDAPAADRALFPAGLLFATGTFCDFVSTNTKLAAELWRMSDEVATRSAAGAPADGPVGFAPAKCSLGLFYEQGEGGLQRDTHRAAELYAESSHMHHANARCNYGLCLLRGEGVSANPQEAARLFSDCAERGLSRAKCCLASCYAQGAGVPRDTARALQLWREAAEENDPRSVLTLGIFHELGQMCVLRDDTIARHLYERATALRDPLGMTRLAHMLLSGRGGAADARRAAQLCSKAHKLGAQTHATVILRTLMAR